MNSAVGEVLPLALGVAISPMAFVAAILALLAPRGRLLATSFVLGWGVGVGVSAALFWGLSSAIPGGEDGASDPVGGTLRVILGGMLGLVAVREWNTRSAAGDEHGLPDALARINTMSPFRVGVLAFLLATVRPKNLLLTATAGVAVAGLPADDSVPIAIMFVGVAVFPLATTITVLRNSEADEATRVARLGRTWRRIIDHDAVIMTVLLTVLAMVVVSRGIAAF